MTPTQRADLAWKELAELNPDSTRYDCDAGCGRLTVGGGLCLECLKQLVQPATPAGASDETLSTH